MKFIKRPVEIEAIEWTGDNFKEVSDFSTWRNSFYCDEKNELIICTLEGHHRAAVGDMIIKGVKGELYPCKPEIFKLTYYTQQEYAESKEN